MSTEKKTPEETEAKPAEAQLAERRQACDREISEVCRKHGFKMVPYPVVEHIGQDATRWMTTLRVGLEEVQ